MSNNATRFHSHFEDKKPWRPYLKFNAQQRDEIQEFFEEFPELKPTPSMEAWILKGLREHQRKHGKARHG